MEWVERLNQCVRYIEEHLTAEIDYNQLGQIACCSAYHFQRMFTYMAGIPLSEYIRRRKMSLAAVDLQSSDIKIIEVAEQYGYRSPTAFNRAFQSIHGVPPSAVRGGGIPVKSYPPIVFKISVKGVEELNYRIESKPAFRVAGISVPLERQIEKNTHIPQFWQDAITNGTIPKLAVLMDTPMKGLLGVNVCRDDQEWRYWIAVATSGGTPEYEELTVPAATWAIFPGSGTNLSIKNLMERIVTEWLPNSGYEYGDGPEIEVYLNPDPENAQYEVWIPVVKAGKA